MLARKNVDLAVNSEQTKRICIASQQNAEQNHGTHTRNKYVKNVTNLEYIGTTLINQNWIQKH